jgi:glyoxylase-like metal-dependent hydrolase (beta-lactamase superfamily II)
MKYTVSAVALNSPPMQYQIIPVTQFQQNCSLIWCEATMRAAVIDPGGEMEKVQAVIVQKGVTLEKIILTHAHIDHAGAVGPLSRAYDIPIEGPHKEDKFWIDSLPMQSQMFGFPQAESFEPNRWLEQGDTVSVGNEILEVRHCPGHTPGHVVFYHRPSKLVIVGDVLFQGSIGRTDFPKGNHATLVASIRRELFSLPEQVQFIPGHGEMSTIGHEKKTNPFVSGRNG